MRPPANGSTATEADPAGRLTRQIFRLRVPILGVLLLLTVMLAVLAARLEFQPGFEKMIPTEHPYIQNYEKHRAFVEGANVVQIAVAVNEGDIFTSDYLETLRQISDEIFLLPGVDRAAMKSLWTKNVQWIAVTVEGFEGDLVIQDSYDGSPEALAQLRENVVRSGEVGRLVANNFTSSIIYAPLLETNPETGERLDYWDFAERLETIRAKYEDENVSIHIIGFAKLIGDLLDGMGVVVGFFGVACAITLVLMYLYSRCIPGTLLPITCSLIAVIWQLGVLSLFGYGLDPFNILVPFLVFAVGVSHGVQMLNAMALQQNDGHAARPAAMRAFDSLFRAGFSAVLSDALGFATLLLVPILVIGELGLAAAIGIAALVVTNLLLLPLLLSFTGLSARGVRHASGRLSSTGWVVGTLAQVVRPRNALLVIGVAAALTTVGIIASRDLKIGDLDQGAPELRPDARYNQDIAHVVANYSTSSDVMILMVETAGWECVSFETLDMMSKLQWRLADVPGVQGTSAATDAVERLAVLLNEGNYRWASIPREQKAIFSNLYAVPEGVFYNADCDVSALFITLDDHKAETLERVIAEVEAFRDEVGATPEAGPGGDGGSSLSSGDFRILLAAGNAGIAAATNQEIERSQTVMLIAIYSAVTAMVFLTFRSLPAVICILVPLGITSILAQALMVWLGIGVKVATLPVIALGVGIGVDYGIYIFNHLQTNLKKGEAIGEAYLHTLRCAGNAVIFTGLTLAIGVGTWVFSPIKFQADMGALLTFMFLWNMVGALTLAPALATFLVPRGKEAKAASALAPSAAE